MRESRCHGRCLILQANNWKKKSLQFFFSPPKNDSHFSVIRLNAEFFFALATERRIKHYYQYEIFRNFNRKLPLNLALGKSEKLFFFDDFCLSVKMSMSAREWEREKNQAPMGFPSVKRFPRFTEINLEPLGFCSSTSMTSQCQCIPNPKRAQNGAIRGLKEELLDLKICWFWRLQPSPWPVEGQWPVGGPVGPVAFSQHFVIRVKKFQATN